MNNKYKHIIDLPYPYPTHHKKMSMVNRGAQFAPFAALTGHDSAIKETARLTNCKVELSDEQHAMLNTKINYLQSLYPHIPTVTLTYFIKDQLKQGGHYCTKECSIKKIDEYERKIIMDDLSFIYIEDIFDMTGTIFNHIENIY